MVVGRGYCSICGDPLGASIYLDGCCSKDCARVWMNIRAIDNQSTALDNVADRLLALVNSLSQVPIQATMAPAPARRGNGQRLAQPVSQFSCPSHGAGNLRQSVKREGYIFCTGFGGSMVGGNGRCTYEVAGYLI